jgi:hypothetical protein
MTLTFILGQDGHVARSIRTITGIHPDDQSRQTAEIMQRFNDVFQLHDPSALGELVAEDCVIENTVPAPDGARHAGKEACVAL